MSNKLFIGGLSWNTTNESLHEAFSKFGQTTECKIVTDRDTGKSKGFGFVAFENKSDADNCLMNMANQMLDGRTIKVDYATERAPAERTARTNNFSNRY